MWDRHLARATAVPPALSPLSLAVEEGYWPRLRAALAASDLQASGHVSRFVLEPDMALLSAFPDGYLVYEAALVVLMGAASSGGLAVGTAPHESNWDASLCTDGGSRGR